MTNAYLLTGSNEGDRRKWLETAMTEIGMTCGAITACSSVYQTAAWGVHEQPDFLNMVLLVSTALSTLQLLTAIKKIEQAAGRQREVKWGQRTLDIDILLYGNEVINLPELVIPHPFLHARRFTLVPLAEIAPAVIHPVSGKSIEELLEKCKDELPVVKLNNTN